MTWVTAFLVFLLVTVRFFAFFSVIRAFRGFSRAPIVLMLSLVCAFGVVPSTIPLNSSLSQTHTLDNPYNLFFLILWQITIGLMLGMPFAVLAEAVSMSGRMVDVLRGAQTGEQMNPALQGVVSSLESAATLAFIALVFNTGVYQVPLTLLVQSFSGTRLESNWLSMSERVLAGDLFWLFIQECLRVAVLWIAPLVLMSILIEWGSGYVGRMLPRIAIATELIPIKLITGIVVLLCLVVSRGWSGSGTPAAAIRLSHCVVSEVSALPKAAR